MDKNLSIYQDIAKRTNGDVYIGVVGPVRCGKSTFIQKFIQNFMLENITNKNDRDRANDELPQAGGGSLIMTTKPQFVPSEAVKIKIGGANMSVRLIDSVGFVVKGALGDMDGENPRMVKTPWSEEKISFVQAAQVGTEKVINDHSTIAIVLTCDGSSTDIPRENYVEAERKTINLCKDTGKPFVVVLNCREPKSEKVIKLSKELSNEYLVPVVPINVEMLEKGDVDSIMSEILSEFPLEVVNVKMPKWLKPLAQENKIIKEILDEINASLDGVEKIGEYNPNRIMFENSESFEPILNKSIELGDGAINIEIAPKEGLFYRVLSEQIGTEIKDDFELVSCLKDLTEAKNSYDKLKLALRQVEETGYGVVVPSENEMELKQPEIYKQSGRFGLRLRASAPSLHIMRVDVETEVSPIMTGYEQGEDFAKSIMEEYENNPEKLWQTNMFGKSLKSLVQDSLNSKVNGMPINLQNKMRRTIGRIVNEGKGGIICILL